MTSPAVLDWDGSDDAGEINAPTWAEVDERLRALNGYDRTILTLTRGDAHLAVGGDAASGLVLYVDLGGEDFRNLIGPRTDKCLVEIVAGGQPGNYQSRQVVSVEQALAAARVFWEAGKLDPAQTWETH
ncbi:Imm1 family immunity protein [Kribbella sp. NPDC056861]|uniref:Imm1 family immunity protein n=1 Tax=Kribbella sp. NPDC056861 TaxID=3154857 RepID=UPI003428DE86